MKTIILMAMATSMLASPAVAQGGASGVRTYIQAGRLLADPASGRVDTNKTIVVEGGKVLESETASLVKAR